MNEYNQLRPTPPFVQKQLRGQESERSSGLISSLSDVNTPNNIERIFITQIRAVEVMSGLRRVPTGFYVAVEIDGKTSKTSIRSTVDEDVVEWYEEILLPSETSTVVFFKIYASFRPGERSGGGVLLRRFKSTVGDLLVLKEGLHPIMFLDQKLLLPRRPLKIVIERRTFHVEASLATLDLPVRGPTNQRLEQLTDIGDRALLRYRQLHTQMDLHEAITQFECARNICPPDHPRHFDVLFNLATAKFIHCQDNNQYHDFDVAISLYLNALQLRTGMHALGHSVTAIDLCFSLLARLMKQGNELDRTSDSLSGIVESYTCRAAWLALQMAEISVSTESEVSQPQYENIADEEVARWLRAILSHTSDQDPDKPAMLADLGNILCRRFESTGKLADIHESISVLENAVRLAPDEHSYKPAWLKDLGDSFMSRFNRLGYLPDLNESISLNEKVVHMTLSGHPDKPTRLNALGISLSRRFERLGNSADINESVLMFEEAVRLTPDGHLEKSTWLNNLGISLSDRFEQLGHHADIVKSIRTNEEVVRLTPDDHPERPARLNCLGKSLLASFTHLGDLKDVNRSILLFEETIHLAPGDHPQKPTWLSNLGSSLLSRFEHLGDPVDLSKSILMIEQAVDVTRDSDPAKLHRLNALGRSLTLRFNSLGDLGDLNKSILIVQQVLHRAPDGHSDRSTWLANLSISLSCRFQHLGDPADIDRSISLIEEAVCLTSDGFLDKPAWLTNLGVSLSLRFERLGDLMDINKSISVNEEAVHLTSVDHPDRPSRLNNLGTALSRRFNCLHNLADISRSIRIFEEAVALTRDDHADRPGWLSNLGIALYTRFQHLGDLEDIEKSVMMIEEAVNLTPDGHPERLGRLTSLGNSLSQRFRSLGDLADIHKSISVIEEAVCLCPTGYSRLPTWLNDLGVSLSYRFERLGDLGDLRRSISISEEAVLLTPDGHPQKSSWTCNLGRTLMECFKHTRMPSQLTSAISHFSVASRASTASVSIRFLAARGWIHAAHLQGDSHTVLDAYTTAIDLLPQLAWLGFPLAERHRLLIQAASVARDAAATALKISGCPEQAVEWLEQGRSIVWSQFLQLRTPVDELRVNHPELAHQFEQISRQLERAGDRDDATSPLAVDSAAARSLEEKIQRHHELALRREKLLVEIRSLQGFDRFLLPKKIDQLAGLVHSGPVVYLNASLHGCDALIVTSESGSVVRVPLPSVRYHEVVQLRGLLRYLLERHRLIIPSDEISALMASENDDPASSQFFDALLERGSRAVKAKPQRLGGYTPDDLFEMVLSFLWENAVKPVVEALGLSTSSSDMEKMPHIYWCPTGPFAFLPIHAAGLYDTAEPGTKLSDFAVSSYIPTLSALASSDRTSSYISLSGNTHLVTVPQPATDGLSGLICVDEEIDHIAMLSKKSPFVTLQESDSTIEDVVEKMKGADWVHFACHGVQDPHNPLDSGLCLADGRRLKLSDIIRLSRPQGGLAFLSACQTAQGDEKLSEESVHLAAGMLLAGYGGVIATMWAIRDHDAPKVTKDVYGHLFRDGKIPECADASVALHCAVQQLRNSGASFASWVPFVHFGR